MKGGCVEALKYKANGDPTWLHLTTRGAGMFEDTFRALWYTEQRCSQTLDIHNKRGSSNSNEPNLLHNISHNLIG
jgi:predicted transposase YbfD/YdcC